MTTVHRQRTLLNGAALLVMGAAACILSWSIMMPIGRSPRVEARRLIAPATAPIKTPGNAVLLVAPARQFQRPVIDPPPPPAPKIVAAAVPPNIQLPREIRLAGVVYSEDAATRVALIRVSESSVESRGMGESLTAHPNVLLKTIDRQSVVLEFQGVEFSLKVPLEASSTLFRSQP